MKRVLLSLFIILSLNVYAQTDKNGNPVFNSIGTRQDTLKDYVLLTNYYTLRNNIDSKTSSVYISDHPTAVDISIAATDLPSDFFIVQKGEDVAAMVMIINKPKRKFISITGSSNPPKEYDCPLKGDISEERAKELLAANFDSKAKLNGDVLYFNDENLKIISNDVIRTAVIDLIEREKLYAAVPIGFKMLSNAEIKKTILEKSQKGGEFDFFTPIEGKEYNSVQVKLGVYDTNLGMALYKWGHASFDLGLNTVEDAYTIFSELKARPVNDKEKTYIKMGFEKALEK